MHIIDDAIRKLIPKKRIEPKQIARRMVSAARSARRGWGWDFKPNVPNEYIIRINRADWDAYYCINQRNVCEALTCMSAKRFEDLQFQYLPPLKTSLVLDASLDDGAFLVDALFGQREAADEMIASAKREKPVGEIAERLVSALKDKDRSNEGSSSMIASLAATMVLQRATIALDGKELAAIHPGDTIGVLRRSEEDAPNIVLDGIDFEFCSQIQGAFGMNAEGWFYKNLGINDAEVGSRGTGWKTVASGEAARLENGGVLRLASGPDLVFFDGDIRQ